MSLRAQRWAITTMWSPASIISSGMNLSWPTALRQRVQNNCTPSKPS